LTDLNDIAPFYHIAMLTHLPVKVVLEIKDIGV